jgi:hypothetical protein
MTTEPEHPTRCSFTPDVQAIVDRARADVEERFGLRPGENVRLLCEKLADPALPDGAYVECGVFQGTTLFAVATFLKARGGDRKLLGLDTFEGFPNRILDDRDRPAYFKVLRERGWISEEHFRKATERTKNFADESHLSGEYFLNVKEVFRIAEEFPAVRLIQGPFAETLATIPAPISVLFLDCDLYRSYLDCLDALYKKIAPGGVVVFDEYYSLKYPGARLAVREFFFRRDGRFEVYDTAEGFERWCFVKPA